MVGARLAQLPIGGDGRNQHEGSANLRNPSLTTEEASQTLNVSARSIERARVVLENPELTAKVDAGEIAVSAAAKLAQPYFHN